MAAGVTGLPEAEWAETGDGAGMGMGVEVEGRAETSDSGWFAGAVG